LAQGLSLLSVKYARFNRKAGDSSPRLRIPSVMQPEIPGNARFQLYPPIPDAKTDAAMQGVDFRRQKGTGEYRCAESTSAGAFWPR
jgi:hypothetical protein